MNRKSVQQKDEVGTGDKELRKATWRLPVWLLGDFQRFCKGDARRLKQDETAGAIFLWMELPQGLRDAVKTRVLGRKGPKDTSYKRYLRGFETEL